jgi:hypothetical protein
MTFFLLLSLGCNPQYEHKLATGNWVESNYTFVDDVCDDTDPSLFPTATELCDDIYTDTDSDCDLATSFADQNNLTYLFGTPSTAYYEDVYDINISGEFNKALETFQTNQNDIFKLCGTQTNPDEPTFECGFPTLAIHFETWKNNTDFFNNGTDGECSTPSFHGETYGVFINETSVFVTGHINLYCNDGRDNLNYEPGDEPSDEPWMTKSCGTNFSSTWTKQ